MAGDLSALEALWSANRRWIAAILLAHKPRWVDVEDLLQDVGTTLVRKVGELREPGALRPWLRTVAINAARAAARERGKVERTSGLSLDDAHQISDSGDRRGRLVPFGAGGRAETSEEASRLMGFAMELPEGYREPLLLKCIKDMSYRQIGELMGLPESTIETRIARGRRMLRELASNPGEVAREAGVRGVR